MYQSNAKFYIKSTITSTQAAASTFLLSEDLELGTHLETGTSPVSFVIKNSTQIERFQITATGGTATIVKRGITQSETEATDSDLQKQWADGSFGYVTILAFNALDAQDTKPDRLTIPTVADATARTALYPTPTGGEMVINTEDAGALENYNPVTAQWEVLGTSTPVVNATTAAAGIVQLAIQATVDAGTDAGSTGATNVVIPSTFNTGITNKIADQSTAEAGASNVKLMTPLRSAQFLAANMASDATARTATDEQKYVNSKQAGYTVRALDSLSALTTVGAAPTERGDTTGNYVKLKEMTAQYTGTYRITFSLKGLDS
jgi:hypothetical protein